MKKKLENEVKEVRLSTRLTSSPACLVGDVFDMSPQMEQMMRAMGQKTPAQKRILELNPKHAVLEKLQAAFEKDKDSPVVDDYAELLHAQALLAEGQKLPDPARFNEVLARLMARGLESKD
jgi:molecular chaperone HtpG